MSKANALKPRLPTDAATSITILANLTGSRAQAYGIVNGTSWPGRLDTTAGGRSNLTAVASTSPTMAGSAALAEAALRRGALSASDVAFLANAVLTGLHDRFERNAVDHAISEFHLDRNNPRHVLSAYAYVWGKYWAPTLPQFFRLPTAGDSRGLNERFARELGRYERDNPGTVFLATNGNAAAQMAIGMVLDGALSGHDVNIGLIHERRSSAVDRALSTDSAVTRTALGIENSRSWIAHHVIPFAVVRDLPVPAQKAIAAAGWRMDSPENLIALPANDPAYYGPPNLTRLPKHNSAHTQYSRDVAAALAPIAATAPQMPPAALLDQLRAVELRFKLALVANRRRYHPRLP